MHPRPSLDSTWALPAPQTETMTAPASPPLNPFPVPELLDMDPLEAALRKAGLTPGEIRVTRLIAQGLKSSHVAERLFIVEKSVKFHLTRIYKKLGLKSRAQLILWCAPHLRAAAAQTHQLPESATFLSRGKANKIDV